MTQTEPRYARAQVVLHWLTLALLLASFVSHESMKDAWRALTRNTEGFTPDIGVQVHVIVGVSVLLLTLVRLALRLRLGAPAPTPGQHPLMTIAAATVHGLIYLMLLALPLTGALAWFGAVTDLAEVHEVLFNVTLALVAAHVGAALFHQFVMRDNLLARMR